VRHTVQLAVQEQYLRGPTMIDKWDHARRMGFDATEPPIDTSGIIQPPLHAVAVSSMVPRLGERGLVFAERAYPRLVDQNAYIRRRRTVNGGLAALVHPWETGLDNSPAWDTRWRQCRPTSNSWRPTRGELCSTPVPESGRLMRTTRGISG
jgi:hypothetical protein